MIEPRARKTVALVLLVSGMGMALAGAFLLLRADHAVAGGVIFGAGILDLILGLYFLRGA